jgi:hypothetical protein
MLFPGGHPARISKGQGADPEIGHFSALLDFQNHLKNFGLHCAPQKYKVNSKISIQILLKEQRFQWMVRQQSSLKLYFLQQNPL